VKVVHLLEAAAEQGEPQEEVVEPHALAEAEEQGVSLCRCQRRTIQL
jgi:hypothetical protein